MPLPDGVRFSLADIVRPPVALGYDPGSGSIDPDAWYYAPVDRLADVFSAVPLVSGLFLDAEFTAPWCVRARVGPEDCAPYVPVPDSIIAFHYVYEGDLVLAVGEDLEEIPPPGSRFLPGAELRKNWRS